MSVHFPHHGLLVIKALIGNYIVHHYIVDEGSSVQILSQDAFEAMGLDVKNLRPLAIALHGFIRHSIYWKGRIDLSVTLEDAPHQTNIVVQFMVVHERPSYNAIIRRLILLELMSCEATNTRPECARQSTSENETMQQTNRRLAIRAS